jgi:hypothetical protein
VLLSVECESCEYERVWGWGVIESLAADISVWGVVAHTRTSSSESKGKGSSSTPLHILYFPSGGGAGSP